MSPANTVAAWLDEELPSARKSGRDHGIAKRKVPSPIEPRRLWMIDAIHEFALGINQVREEVMS